MSLEGGLAEKDFDRHCINITSFLCASFYKKTNMFNKSCLTGEKKKKKDFKCEKKKLFILQ